MKNRRTDVGACGAAFLMLMSPLASGDIVTGVDQNEFGAAVVEVFQAASVRVDFYDFGNGMVYRNLVGQTDLINFTGTYGMGNGPGINAGLEGAGDGYFGTLETPTTFELSFAGGVTHFGFYGAESHLNDGSQGRNGELDMVFYDTSDNLIGTIAELTPPDTHAWEQWHGFTTDDGTLIGRIVFAEVGHMVLDNVSFIGSSGTPARLTSFTVLDGTLISGGLPRLRRSDDRYLEIEARVTGEVAQPHLMRMRIIAESAVQNPAEIVLTFESHITDVEGTVWLFLRNWRQGEMVQVAEFPVGMTDEVQQVTLSRARRFIRAGDGRIVLRIKKIVFFPFTLGGFHSLIDQVEMVVR